MPWHPTAVTPSELPPQSPLPTSPHRRPRTWACGHAVDAASSADGCFGLDQRVDVGVRHIMKSCLALLSVVAMLIYGTAGVEAQGVLGLPKASPTAPAGALPQTIPVQAAAPSNTCSSISSMSRRCHFTFAAECKKRGESKAHCTRMAGFCHACTDIYAKCKGAALADRKKKKSASTNCAGCNAGYSQCIDRMVIQYGGKLIKVR